jgi:heme-degrading monooxygenase HmoA
VIVLNCVVKCFVERIREKLGKLDFNRNADIDEAPYALAVGGAIHVSGHQNAVVEGLETHVDVELRTLTHTDYGVAHLVVDGHVDRLLAHLAGAVHDIDHRDGVRGFTEVWHEGKLYPTRSLPAEARIRQDVGMITEHAELPIIPGREEAFEAAFAAAKHIIASSPGFGGLTLSRNLERPSTYLLLVQWGTLDDHEVGFRKSPAYEDWKAALHHFYSPPATVEHYELVATASA